MDSTSFSSKWGVQKDELVTYKINTLLIAQFVITLALFAIVQPKFLLQRRHATKVCELSWIRTTLVAGLIVLFTFGYPQLLGTR